MNIYLYCDLYLWQFLGDTAYMIAENNEKTEALKILLDAMISSTIESGDILEQYVNRNG